VAADFFLDQLSLWAHWYSHIPVPSHVFQLWQFSLDLRHFSISLHFFYPGKCLGWQSPFCSQFLFLLGSYLSQQACRHYLHFVGCYVQAATAVQFNATTSDTIVMFMVWLPNAVSSNHFWHHCHVYGVTAQCSLQSSHCWH
jgi:hypothetical protein